MLTLKLDTLEPTPSLPYALHHEGGDCILELGMPLLRLHIRILKEIGVAEVWALEPQDSTTRFLRERSMKSVPVEGLTEGTRLAWPLYDADDTLLLDAKAAVPRSVLDNLQSRRITTVYVRLTPEERKLDQLARFRQELKKSETKDRATSARDVDKIRGRFAPPDRDPLGLSQLDEAIEKEDVRSPETVGPPLNARREPAPDLQKPRPVDLSAEFQNLKGDALSEVEKLFHLALTDGQRSDGEFLGHVCARVVRALLRDKDLLLGTAGIRKGRDYLVWHSANVAVLSANIATVMGWSEQDVLEVTYAGLLHDLGMLKVPRRIVAKPGRLDRDEMLEVQRHPIYGADIVQRIRNIPSSAAFVAYQAHERLDGSGYIRGRSARTIHRFARVVSVADVFDALNGERPHRKAYLPYNAMEQVIFMGRDRKLDPDVVRGLLKAMGLFPVGSWVELSEGSVGRVIAINETHYDRPVVRVLYQGGKKTERPLLVNLPEQADVRVVRAIDGQGFEAGALEGF